MITLHTKRPSPKLDKTDYSFVHVTVTISHICYMEIMIITCLRRIHDMVIV